VEPVHHRNFRQIDGFCDQLLQFIEAARRFEEEGKDAILTYGFISACASQIRFTAEERRRALARIQYEQVLGEDFLDITGLDSSRLAL
jgi:monoamine oxidase